MSMPRLFLNQFSGSTFLQQTLSQGYPRFLRLFQDFFARIALHTDTVYTETQQRYTSLSETPLCSLHFKALKLSLFSVPWHHSKSFIFQGPRVN
jgi:hypothetical protein